MKLTKDNHTTVNAIDDALFSDAFQQARLDGSEYAPWYARLLTSLTLAVGDQPIEYAQNDYDYDDETTRLVLYLPGTLVLVEVSGLTGDAPMVTLQVLPRKSLTAFTVSADMRIDAKGAQATGWPGTVEVQVTYSELESPLILRGAGADPYHLDTRSQIMKLIEALSSDLSS